MDTAKTKLAERTVVNTDAIAKMFNMTPRNVRYLTEDGVIAKVGHGRYDLVDTVGRYVTFLKTAGSGMDESQLTESLEYEKWLHEKAKREKAEIELSHIKREMHKSDEVEKVLNNMLMAFRSKILSMPSKIATQIVNRSDPKYIEAILEKEMHEALLELVDYNPAAFFSEDEEVEVGEIDGTETDHEIVSESS